MSEIAIRAARESDLPALTPIEASGAATFEQHGQPLADGSPLTPSEHWASYLRAGLLWIAEDSDAGAVGFLAADRQGGGLYVAEVDVVMTHQRKGIGRRLMQAAIEQARSEGLVDVTLTTFRAIPWNAPFYNSLGFREVSGAVMPRHLAAKLADEAARGFQDRCGMRLEL